MSYHDDHRVRAQRDAERRRFDQKRMTLTVEVPNPAFETTDDDNEPEFVDVVLPAVYEVCSTCEGKGSHVNPSIDAHGISGEEFAEDPDFEESYLAGHYDVTCYGCGGMRVVPVVDEDRASKADLALYEAHADECASYDAEEASEARYFAAFDR
jgi:hypothetical protein